MGNKISFTSGLSFRMVCLIVLLLVETKFFYFIGINSMPYLQVTSSTRINTLDVLTIVLLTYSLFSLVRRRERPIFTVALVILFCVIIFNTLLGILSGTANLAGGGVEIFRWLFRYAIYFIIVATVDSRQSLETFIKVLYAFAIIGLILQFLETANGEYFVLNEKWDDFFGGTPYIINVGAEKVPYIWNRVIYYLYITFFLSVSFFFRTDGLKWKNFLYLCLAFLGFMFMLIRSTFVFMFVGIVVMLFLSHHRSMAIKYGLKLLGLLFIGLLVYYVFFTSVNFDETFIGITLMRLQTLLNFQEESSFIDRAYMLSRQYAFFLGSPIFGHGPGKATFDVINTDTGLINTLVIFGLVGLIAVFNLIITIFYKATRILRQVEKINRRAYTRVLGLIGVMAGSTSSYPFNFDGFIMLPLMTVLVIGLLDRIKAFYIE